MSQTILILEPEEHLRGALLDILEGTAGDVVIVAREEDAVQALGRHEVAVLVCSHERPGLIEVCRRMRPDAVHIGRLLGDAWDDGHVVGFVEQSLAAYRLTRENRTLVGQLEPLRRSLRDTVGILVSVLDAYDPNLGMHAQRVGALAVQISRKLNLDDETTREVEYAALLHDIGKISRLHASGKPVAATSVPVEESSAALLLHVHGFESVAKAVRHHTEKFDGSGRPDGLKGDAIPLASRIVCVANRYDKAMYASYVPTRPDVDKACRILEKGMGRVFDPTIAQLLMPATDDEPAVEIPVDVVEVSPHQIGQGMILAHDLDNINGVLLLAAGTTLTRDHVEKIRSLARDNMLATTVQIRCDPVRGCPVPSLKRSA